MAYTEEKNDLEAQSKSQAAPVVEPQAETLPAAPLAEEQVQGEPEAKNKDAAQKQFEKDAAFRNENPDEPIVRPANPEVGGESF